MEKTLTETSKGAFLGVPGMDDLKENWFVQDAAGHGLIQCIQEATATPALRPTEPEAISGPTL